VAITAFGTFCVVARGEERTRIFSPRTRRCLAHLAIREDAIDRALLAAELWPDADQTNALGSLRRRLHELETAFQQLGLADPLVVSRNRVALAPAVQWSIDVAQYAILSRDPTKAQRAAALYREPIFPGIDDDVLERERRRLHGVQVELLAYLLDLAIRQGSPEAIASGANAIIRLDPLSEQSVAKAIAALNELGEADRARRLAGDLAESLHHEVDAEPAVQNLDLRLPDARRVLAPIVDRAATLRGARASRYFGDLEARMPEIRAALDAAIVRETDVEMGVRALAALSRFFFDRGHAVEAFRWYEAAIPRLLESSPEYAEALYLQALVGRNLGSPDHNLPAFERAIAALRGGGDRVTLAKAMLYGSNAARMTGRIERSERLAREAHAILMQSGDAYLIAFAHSALGATAYALGQLDDARSELEEARAGFAACGARTDEALMLVNVGRCAFGQGDLVTAKGLLTRALQCAAESKSLYVKAHAEVGLALVALDLRDLHRARRHAAAAAQLSLNGSDTELSVISVEAAGELFLALGEYARARDALAAADGVRSEFLIARAPTEHARSERLRAELARRSLLIESGIGAADVMMRSLLQSVARSYTL
jgi:DNA-binding SARP family transcriptional activator